MAWMMLLHRAATVVAALSSASGGGERGKPSEPAAMHEQRKSSVCVANFDSEAGVRSQARVREPVMRGADAERRGNRSRT